MSLVTLFLYVCLASACWGRGLDSQWQQYKHKHGKVYGNFVEDLRRKNAFMDNLEKVEDHNRQAEAGLRPFRLDINQFADLTNEEYRNLLKPRQSYGPSLSGTHNSTRTAARNPGDIPESLDWRTSGFVGPVRDQGQLGNSVVIATVDAVEFGERRIFKSLVSLSTQQLLECCGTDPCQNSCRQTGECLLCVTQLGGLESEASYPSRQCQACNFQMRSAALVVEGFLRPDKGSEVVLKADVATLGLGVASVDASHPSFQLYTGGIYEEPNCSSTNLDHAMAIVGYGNDNGKDYWLLKNSWGSAWGEDGYIRMSRNNGNQCGVASDVWFPVVTHV